ncbi:MAG TPA: DUF3574 domain-containing protein [Burkholderiales bacterium]|nr:DUF3574 domain-containing protein [Burkholderiales bacterium]
MFIVQNVSLSGHSNVIRAGTPDKNKLGLTQAKDCSMSPFRIAATVTLSFAVTACAALNLPSCKRGEELAVQDSLYFGTGMRKGVVTTEERAKFLEVTVTSRFPQGLTVWQALGQWRGADGSIVRELTDVLQIIHPDDALSETSVAEIVAAYKAAFQQEAVLRVRDSICVSF